MRGKKKKALEGNKRGQNSLAPMLLYWQRQCIRLKFLAVVTQDWQRRYNVTWMRAQKNDEINFSSYRISSSQHWASAESQDIVVNSPPA